MKSTIHAISCNAFQRIINQTDWLDSDVFFLRFVEIYCFRCHQRLHPNEWISLRHFISNYFRRYAWKLIALRPSRCGRNWRNFKMMNRSFECAWWPLVACRRFRQIEAPHWVGERVAHYFVSIRVMSDHESKQTASVCTLRNLIAFSVAAKSESDWPSRWPDSNRANRKCRPI